MKLYKDIKKQNWKQYTERPEINSSNITATGSAILKDVKERKDVALIEYAKKFENVEIKTLLVSNEEIETAKSKISDELKQAIAVAKANIEKFHKAQKTNEEKIETTKGVTCWRKAVAIEKVGLYIPGGSAPLFSTILMLGIPATLAGCANIVLCTPPNTEGSVHPAILYTASLLGITQIFKVGGAQAIAAMAYGTETIPQVYKIFGPGNQYVTKAKEIVQQTGVAIDMPAGPSEVLIIADITCNPQFVAADLLAQAEHGPDSQVIVLSDTLKVLEEVLEQVSIQLEKLPRKEMAHEALTTSKAILLSTIIDCIDFSNLYAPEHLIIASENAHTFEDKIINAGSVFIGNYACESAGDYASGTNHTLPTNGFAKNYSGVSLESFQKKITFQKITKSGIQNLGPTIEILAETEGLFAHKNAVTLRLKNLKDV